MIKMSGGDNGLYIDPDAGTNYTDAKAAGKHVGGYHFVGWSAGAAQEASFFLKAMAPLAENDVYALDAENGSVDVSASSPAYLLAMAEYIHNAIGVWPLVYMNLNTLNSYDWSAVLANCGLWLADWAVAPTANIPTQATYVMQQYSDGPVYDHDEYFGSLASFDAYGWHAPAPVPAPTPPSPPVVIPVTTPPPPIEPIEPTPAPVITTPVSPPSPGTSVDGIIPPPPAVPKPAPVVTGPITPVPAVRSDTVDVIIRTVKSYIAAVIGVLGVNGFDWLNNIHLSAADNARLAGLVAAATAVMNIIIKVYNSIRTPKI